MTPFEEWKSLYTNEVEKIWNSSRQELRKCAMILCVLKEEFQRVEDGFKKQLDKFEQQFEVLNEPKGLNNCSLFDIIPRQSRKTIDVEELNRSPTINRKRNNTRIGKSFMNSSLHPFKENLVTTHWKAKEEHGIASKLEAKEEHDDTTIPLSLETEPSLDLLLPIRSRAAQFKTPFKPADNVDVVDSSFIIEDSPVDSYVAKPKKSKFKKSLKPQTLTQLFSSLPSQTNLNSKKSKFAVSSDDDTFCELEQPKKSFKTNKKAFVNYDECPKIKSKSPEYVHQSDPVRRRADRLKLPGWSCDECKNFYESLNLPPDELKKKMDICSRHRSKFQVMNKTIEGFWNPGMPLTQDD